MSSIIQHIYIAVLGFAYRNITSKISEKARNTAILMIFVLFFLYFIVLRSAEHYQVILRNIGFPHRIGSILLLIVAVLSVNGELHEIKYKKSLAIPYVLFALGILAIRILHPIGAGYVSFGCMLLVIYPCIYIVWNNRRDYETLFDMMAVASMFAGLLYFFRVVFMTLQDRSVMAGSRPTGGMYNANFLGFIGISMACSALYYWYRCVRKEVGNRKAGMVLSGLSLLSGGMLIGFSKCRSALIIVAASVIIVFIISVKNYYSEATQAKKKLKKYIILSLAVLLIVGFLVIQSGSADFLLQRFSLENKSLDQFSSGRVGLWKSFAQNLNLLGHNMNTLDWDALTLGQPTRHVHNTFLDFSFRFGVPVGTLFLIFHFLSGIMTLCLIFNPKENRSYVMFIAICMIHFTVHALIDIATLPLESYGPFYFYFAIAPLFLKKDIYKGAHAAQEAPGR